MTRARILADYVAGGTTATEFDYLDGLTSAAVGINDTQTLTNKTLTNATFPAGNVLQIQTSNLFDWWSYNNNSSAWDFGTASTRSDQSHGSVVDDLSITVTAKGASSIFLLNLQLCQFANSNMDGGFNMGINIYSSADSYANPVQTGATDSGNRKPLTFGQWITYHTDNYVNENISCIAKHAPAIAKDATISYRVCISTNYISGGNVLYLNDAGPLGANETYNLRGLNTLQVTEIAA